MNIVMFVRPNFNTVFGGDVVQFLSLQKELVKRGHNVLIDDKSSFDMEKQRPIIDPTLRLFEPEVAIMTSKGIAHATLARHMKLKTLWCTVLYGWYSGKEDDINFQRNKKILKLVDALIFLGPTEREYWKKFHKCDCQDFIVHNGVDIPKEVFQNIWYESPFDGQKFALMAHRIEPNKGQVFLLRTMIEMEKKPYLFMCGGQMTATEQYIKTVNNLCSRPELKDFVVNNSSRYGSARNAVFSLMTQAHVALQPSGFECAPLATFEAARLGCNVIVTENSLAKDYLGNTAWYVKHGDKEALKKAINEAMEAERNEKKSKEKISKFTWARAAEEMENAIKDTKTK